MPKGLNFEKFRLQLALRIIFDPCLTAKNTDY